MTMSRSLFILLLVVVASSSSVSAQQSNRDRYFDDFRGQSFCSKRQGSREGQCCPSRIDECSVPIAGTLCYCDQFCDQHINPDCCPDYENVCKGAPPSLVAKCEIQRGVFIREFEEQKDNCNLCKCKREGRKECEADPCLSDPDVIDGINSESASLGWKAYNYSQFYGHKLKEGLAYRLGTFEPRVRVKSMSRLSNRVETLEKEFNALNHWSGSISAVRDQGWCGSSWAVSTASVASDRFGIKSKTVVDLASQHLLSCVKNQGCAGGHLDNAWRFLNRVGVADDACYPYEAVFGRCRAKKTDTLTTMNCDVPVHRAHEGFYKMGPAYSLNNETDIMWEIFHYGPVQATMWVYPDFFVYSSGIYRRSTFGDPVARGFHSVRLVGWGEDRTNYGSTKYWLAANSWGTWWGNKGYFKILRGNNECGIESYVLSSLADVHDGKLNSRHAKRSGRRVERKSQTN